MAPRPIIIDTDPGQDDALAILLALASPELEVLGITAVAGNVPLALTQKNARKVCELAGRPDVPVFAGCPRPILRPLHTAEQVHGASGLDGADLPEPRMPLQPQHAVDWLVDTLLAAEEKSVTLCPLGPLTNIALAIIKEPVILTRVREIVLMGGGFFEGGNTTPAAEFNIYVDPHAAAVVFAAGVPLTVIPLDCTHKALITKDWLARVRAAGRPLMTKVAGLLDFYERFDVAKYGMDGGPLHDPCVIAFLLQPALFAGRHCAVAVETASEATMGMTVVDWWGVTGREPNATVLRDVDARGFFDLLFERLMRLPLAA
jgi:purine nucleosidase